MAGMIMLTMSFASGQQIMDTASVGQTEEPNPTDRRHFIGSSLFVLLNLAPDAGDFYQLDYGYWCTTTDAITIEAITWKYHAPLGIPYGSAVQSYPGYVRAYGIGVEYKRLLWKRFYSTFHATPLLQQFFNAQSDKIQSGFQLFLQVRLGYHIELFKNRFYLEPAVAFNYWPINTNLPASFADVERRWPSYFLFEPGLHFGMTF
jgi:hypothetical protein